MEKLKSQKAIVALVIAIVVAAYLILPFDIIPDVAVGPGQIDDAAVALIGLALEVINFCRGGKAKKDSRDQFEEASYREVDS